MKTINDTELSAVEPIGMGDEDGSGLKIAVVVATYNTKISQGLLDGCIRGLDKCKVANRKIIKIDGSFELPLIAQKCINSYDGVICLGAVIKGDTAHFEYVSDQTARGIQDVMLKYGKPVVFGVLTTYNFAQALERTLDDDNNKGLESALTAVKMCNLIIKLN
jgi:6,7-dimethyl-8-ribityllumazine synthase